MRPQRTMLPRQCDHCGTPYVSKQSRKTRYCSHKCYSLAAKGHGAVPAVERFWPKVNKDGPVPIHRPELGPCWIWLAFLNNHGYGTFWDGRQVFAHVWAYTACVGPVPDGYELDHLCRRASCCNPAHLEPVTHAENIRRSYDARRAGRG